MKKLLAVLLALVMLVSLAACAGNTDKDNPPAATLPQTPTIPV